MLYIAYANLPVPGKIDEHLCVINEDRRIRRAGQHLVAQEDGHVARCEINAHNLVTAAIGCNDEAGRSRGAIHRIGDARRAACQHYHRHCCNYRFGQQHTNTKTTRRTCSHRTSSVQGWCPWERVGDWPRHRRRLYMWRRGRSMERRRLRRVSRERTARCLLASRLR
jgi:hypothetical protein